MRMTLVAAALLAMQMMLVADVGYAQAAPAVRTVKERLSSKVSDDQRINNCKVPVELRGARPRPDACAGGAATSAAALPITGSANYTLIGNTDPTDGNGNVGFLGSATLQADFTNQTVSSTLNSEPESACPSGSSQRSASTCSWAVSDSRTTSTRVQPSPTTVTPAGGSSSIGSDGHRSSSVTVVPGGGLNRNCSGSGRSKLIWVKLASHAGSAACPYTCTDSGMLCSAS